MVHFTNESVTQFPFTPTSDGILFLQWRASSTGRCYVNTSIGLFDGYALSGDYAQACKPVAKGTQITISGTHNLNGAVTYTFTSFGN